MIEMTKITSASGFTCERISQLQRMACVDIYGPRLIATVCLVPVSRSRLLMYIRLFRAAR